MLPTCRFRLHGPHNIHHELEIIGMFNETLTSKGPTNVSRGDPYDPGDGRIKIDTEIVSMDLVGTSDNIGLITIIESPSKTSSGTTQQWDPGQNAAHSPFDIFVEIQTTLAPPLSTLHNDDPVFVHTTIYDIPPWGSRYTSPLEPIPLKDEENNIIGFIKHVYHKIGTGPTPIGGISVPVDECDSSVPYLLAPCITSTSIIIVATVATAIYAERIKRREEKL